MRIGTQFQHAPGLSWMSPDQCEEIYLAALEVLDRVGVRVHEPRALALLQAAGARVEGDRVRLPAGLVQQALATAPCRVPVGRRGCGDPAKPAPRAMLLEKGRIYFGTGSDTQYTVDLETGERRAARKADVAAAARLCDALEHIDFVMSLGLASDVPTGNSYVHQAEAMILNTGKPLVYTAADRRDVEDILAMGEAVAGGREAQAANPSLILYAEPTSPLQHSREALEKLVLCAERRMPVIYLPALMLGATGPVTPAGGVVVATAESLSGLVIHQLAAPGAPFIAGGAGPAMDMRTSLCSYGSPELQITCASMVTMARHLELPCFCTAGCSDAQVFDQQAGMEAGYTILMQALAGGNLIHDLGYIGAGMTSSMEMLLLCNEMAGMVRHILRGIPMDRKSLALETIEAVGPGGNYFTEEHTVENFRKALHFGQFGELLSRADRSRWEAEGAKSFGERARERARELVASHDPGELPGEVAEAVRAVSRRRDGEV